MKENVFGYHLLIEGYSDSPNLVSIPYITWFLTDLTRYINMSKLSEPYVHYINTEDDFGISGIIIIKESHISIHTWPRHNFLTMDIYSCKDFNPDKVISFCVDKFSVYKYKHRLIERSMF